MKKKIALFVPDGVGIRNYLFSSLVDNLLKEAELILITSISSKAIKEMEKVHNSIFKVIPVPDYKESVWEKFLRELENISRLRYFTRKLKNSTLIPNHEWKKLSKHSGISYWFYFFIKIVSFLLSNYKCILFINKLYLNSVSKSVYLKGYLNILEEIKPDVILCTHQRAITASPLFIAAKQKHIQTVTAIYSWDNLPKARMAFRADKYLVWSQYMKDEIKLYYPEIPEKTVIVTGTPQFEFYLKSDLIIDHKEFCKKYGFDANRPIICYSGGDVLTSPYDQIYLGHLAEAIANIAQPQQPQILFRRCPVDWSERFNDVLRMYSDIITSVDPIWEFEKDKGKKWSLTYPLFEDVKLLVNVAYHSNLVYNVGSTMAHDYSMFNRPACYINYNPSVENDEYVQEIYKFQHFRSMPSLNTVVWINSKDEIKSKILNAIENPDKIALDRKKWLEKIILHPVDEASIRITRALLD